MHEPVTPLYLTSDMRRLERAESGSSLMAKAGQALATLAHEIAENSDPVLVIAGPGNNGGDALVAARLLKQHWHPVIVVLAADPGKLPADAAQAYQSWMTAGGSCLDAIPENTRFSLAIDGLFGIGLQRPLEGRYAGLVNQINALPCPVLAIDVPSGLDADTGRVLGCAVEADITLTLLAAKPGLYTLDGPDHAGTVIVSDLGIDTQALADPRGWLLEGSMFSPALPPRKQNSHKGLFGNVTIIGGSEGMTGAALLAGRAALLCGGGRVYVGLFAENAPLADTLQPELMLRRAADLHEEIEASCAVIGPGLGRSPQAVKVLDAWLGKPLPLVLDADALQLVAQGAELKPLLHQREFPTVMTPHPGEAAALANCSSQEIQHDRIASAVQLAKDYRAIVILKGAGTVIAEPDGRWYINTSGNPGLSSAGTGDVLAGMAGAFIAQGVEAGHAARLAVWLHGAAADGLVSRGIGPVGLTASEVALEVRTLINRGFPVESTKHQQQGKT